MFVHRSLLLGVGLSLAACSDTSIRTSTRDASMTNATVNVHIVEAEGGG